MSVHLVKTLCVYIHAGTTSVSEKASKTLIDLLKSINSNEQGQAQLMENSESLKQLLI